MLYNSDFSVIDINIVLLVVKRKNTILFIMEKSQ